MGQAYPALAKEASYQASVLALQSLGDDLTKAQELPVSNQLGLLAQQLQELSKALSTPIGPLALAGGSSQQMQALGSYLAELGKAVPAVAANPSYQSIMARLAKLDAAAKQMQTTPPTDLTAALAALKQEVDGLTADVVALQTQSLPRSRRPVRAAEPGGAGRRPGGSRHARSGQIGAASGRLTLAALTAFAKAQLPDGNLHAERHPAERRRAPGAGQAEAGCDRPAGSAEQACRQHGVRRADSLPAPVGAQGQPRSPTRSATSCPPTARAHA